MKDIGWFWFWAVALLVLAAWNALPGPWWCKLLLIAVCQLIPGGFDELALVAITAAYRRHRHAAQLES